MAQRVLDLLKQMKENGEEMRLWKNVALSRQCLDILETIDDVSPAERALVLDNILSLIPEYDVPRYALELARLEQHWLSLANEQECGLSMDDVKACIHELEEYIDYENITTDDFIHKYGKHLKFDPIRRTPLWEENYCRWEEECDRRLGDFPRGMGFCFAYWHTFAEVLREEGVEWKSPSQMNPRVLFD